MSQSTSVQAFWPLRYLEMLCESPRPLPPFLTSNVFCLCLMKIYFCFLIRQKENVWSSWDKSLDTYRPRVMAASDPNESKCAKTFWLECKLCQKTTRVVLSPLTDVIFIKTCVSLPPDFNVVLLYYECSVQSINVFMVIHYVVSI